MRKSVKTSVGHVCYPQVERQRWWQQSSSGLGSEGMPLGCTASAPLCPQLPPGRRAGQAPAPPPQLRNDATSGRASEQLSVAQCPIAHLLTPVRTAKAPSCLPPALPLTSASSGWASKQLCVEHSTAHPFSPGEHCGGTSAFSLTFPLTSASNGSARQELSQDLSLFHSYHSVAPPTPPPSFPLL